MHHLNWIYQIIKGTAATETICTSLNISAVPKVNTFVVIPGIYNGDRMQINLYRLPSSSRAYPMSFDKKVQAYRQMFEEVGIPVDGQN